MFEGEVGQKLKPVDRVPGHSGSDRWRGGEAPPDFGKKPPRTGRCLTLTASSGPHMAGIEQVFMIINTVK